MAVAAAQGEARFAQEEAGDLLIQSGNGKKWTERACAGP
jgi:hypothetical protein